MIQLVRAHVLQERKQGKDNYFDLRLIYGARDEEVCTLSGVCVHREKREEEKRKECECMVCGYPVRCMTVLCSSRIFLGVSIQGSP